MGNQSKRPALSVEKRTDEDIVHATGTTTCGTRTRDNYRRKRLEILRLSAVGYPFDWEVESGRRDGRESNPRESGQK